MITLYVTGYLQDNIHLPFTIQNPRIPQTPDLPHC